MAEWRIAATDPRMVVVDVGGHGGNLGRPIRDAVTGEILTDERGRMLLPSAGSAFIRVRDERVERMVTPIERTPIPRMIDTAQPYPGGALGGKRWHPEFAHYIGDLRPRAVEEADRAHREWWREDYAQARVRAGFIARYGAERGAEACDIALAALAGGHDALTELAERCGRSAAWVARQRSLAYRFAFAKREHAA